MHAALARHAGIDASCLDVDVRGSVVTLRGVVHTLAERQAVMRTAWSSHGVSDVVDDLQLAE